jgi:large subunit ribosomal protein L23
MLIKPLISEKSMAEAAKSKYTFVVEGGDTKFDIKRNVEKQFGVNVVKVSTLIMPGKVYKTGKRWKFEKHNDWKKAIVQVKPGQKIDLFEVKEEEKK